MTFLPNLTAQTAAILRNCTLTIEADRLGFVRCRAPTREAAMAAAAEIGEPGVFLAHNAEAGGYYLRVNRGTQAFGLICQMKS